MPPQGKKTREKVLDAVLVFSFDKRTARDVKKGVVSIEDALKDLDKQVQDVDESLGQLADGFRIVELAGDELSTLGERILQPMQDAARGYVEQAGRADAASRRWLSASEDLEKTQFRIGRAAATAILPYLEKAADLAEKAADFVDKNPQLIAAALKVGAIVAGLGAVGMAVTKGIKLYTDVRSAAMAAKQFIAAKMMQAAAKQQLAAAAGMQSGAGAGVARAGVAGAAKTFAISAAVAAGGAMVGAQLADKVLGPLIMGAEEWEQYMGGLRPMQKVAEIVGQTVAVIGHGFSQLGEQILRKLGLNKLADQYAGFADEMVIRINDMTSSIGKANEGFQGLSSTLSSPALGQALDAYIDFRREEADAMREYEKDRARTIRDFGREMVRMEEEYQRDRARTIRDFERDQLRELEEFEYDRGIQLEEFERERQLEEDEYYRERQLRAKEHSREMEQAEKEHQLQLRRDLEDHHLRIRDAVSDRDFDAYRQEVEEYELQRKRAEEDHNRETALTQEQFARDQALEEAEYQRQQALRSAEFQYQLDQEQEQFDRQREQSRVDHDRELADMVEEHERERALNRVEHDRELADMKTDWPSSGSSMGVGSTRCRMIGPKGSSCSTRTRR